VDDVAENGHNQDPLHVLGVFPERFACGRCRHERAKQVERDPQHHLQNSDDVDEVEEQQPQHGLLYEVSERLNHRAAVVAKVRVVFARQRISVIVTAALRSSLQGEVGRGWVRRGLRGGRAPTSDDGPIRDFVQQNLRQNEFENGRAHDCQKKV
jgi:hypothetical protein